MRLYNYGMQLTVRSDTACANSAQAAPAQPAADAGRWAYFTGSSGHARAQRTAVTQVSAAEAHLGAASESASVLGRRAVGAPSPAFSRPERLTPLTRSGYRMSARRPRSSSWFPPAPAGSATSHPRLTRDVRDFSWRGRFARWSARVPSRPLVASQRPHARGGGLADEMPNNAMQQTVRPGTRLAVPRPRISPKGGEQGARPSRPAADRGRSLDNSQSNANS